MPNEYEGETCAGCVHYELLDRGKQCLVPSPAERNETALPGEKCEYFKPSPTCRIARALESIASLGFEAFAKYVGGRVTRSTIDSAGPE